MHRYNPKADCKSVRIDNGRLEQIVLRAITTQCALLDAKVRSIEKKAIQQKPRSRYFGTKVNRYISK